jgi:hypothetical protein
MEQDLSFSDAQGHRIAAVPLASGLDQIAYFSSASFLSGNLPPSTRILLSPSPLIFGREAKDRLKRITTTTAVAQTHTAWISTGKG